MGVRAAVVADAPAIARVQCSSWDSTYRGLMPDNVLDRMTVEARSPIWEQALTGGATIFVATDAGDVIGFCSVAAHGDAGEITAMYAIAEVWGRGFGRALMAEATGWFRAQGLQTAFLWVLDTNEIGRRFYESAGWGADGTVKTDEVFGAEVDHVRYTISL